MGHLHLVEQDHILQLHGIAYHAAVAYQSAAANEGAMPHLGFGADDARCAQISGGRYLSGVVNPYMLADLGIFFAQRAAQGDDIFFDTLQRFPGIVKLLQIGGAESVAQIV